MGPPRAPSHPARACSGPRSAAPPLASDPAAVSSRVSRSSARANRGRSGSLGVQRFAHLGDLGLCAGGRGPVEAGGRHGVAQFAQRPARVLGADQGAVLAAADVLVAGDVVDHAAVLAADIEGHLALPGGPPCGHGIGMG